MPARMPTVKSMPTRLPAKLPSPKRPPKTRSTNPRRSRRYAPAETAHWGRVALERLSNARDAGDDIFAYNVFAASEEDLERIRTMMRALFRQLRAVIAASPVSEAVGLINF